MIIINYGVIDLGSNSIRLVIYKVSNEKIKIIYNKRETVGLISYLDINYNLSDEGILLLEKIIVKLKNEAFHFNIDGLHIIGTEVIRVANNKQIITTKIKDLTGIDLEVISREKEAELGVYGLMSEFSLDNGLITDIGGGSTKTTLMKSAKIDKSNIMPIGSLNAYLEFAKDLSINEKEILQLRKLLKEQLQNFERMDLSEFYLYGIGGTFKALKKLIDDYYNQNLNYISAIEVRKIIKELTINYKKNYLNLLRLIPERIHTIVPGLIIIDEIISYYKIEKILIGKNGIREGFIIYKTLLKK